MEWLLIVLIVILVIGVGIAIHEKRKGVKMTYDHPDGTTDQFEEARKAAKDASRNQL